MLIDQIEAAWDKLNDELSGLDAAAANWICVDDWSVKDMLAVRLWWTRSVLNWVEAGRRGNVPVTPAKGYRWNETPRLNAAIVNTARKRTFNAIVTDLRRQYRRLLVTIDDLEDRELLEPHVFAWAGSYPIARWLSINTTRQYQTARTYVRRARKQAQRDA